MNPCPRRSPDICMLSGVAGNYLLAPGTIAASVRNRAIGLQAYSVRDHSVGRKDPHNGASRPNPREEEQIENPKTFCFYLDQERRVVAEEVVDGDGPVVDQDDFGRFYEDGDGFTSVNSHSHATTQMSQLPVQ